MRRALGLSLPSYLSLVVEGEDVRPSPLKERQTLLEKIVLRYGMEKGAVYRRR
jgi:ATP-dependent DNA ligase